MKNLFFSNSFGLNKTRAAYLARLLIVFLASLLTFEGFLYFTFSAQYSVNLKALKHQETTAIRLYESIISTKIEWILSDLHVLSNQNEIKSWAESKRDIALIEKELLAFSNARKTYDQVRLIDSAGMEVVRVNYKNGMASVVPKQNLQDKGNRYYFQETMDLERGQTYASPLDLNIEHGRVETPHKPMIRFGIPIFNASGQRAGAIILNYFGETLLQSLEKAASMATGKLMIINQEGYWLMGGSREENWGFMFPHNKSKTFAKRYPAIWSTMQNQAQSQSQKSNGVFSWKLICPVPAPAKEAVHSSKNYSTEKQSAYLDHCRWWLVSQVSAMRLQEFSKHLQGNLRVTYFAAGLTAMIFSLFAASFWDRHNKKQLTLNKMAHFDPLTELPNRNQLTCAFSHVQATLCSNTGSIGFFMIDLDGFKRVNDTYGHECGDLLLKEVATRFKGVIRNQDTLARIGGDEFCLLIPDLKLKRNAALIAQKLLDSLQAPITYVDKTIFISASIGGAAYPDAGKSLGELMKAADLAMYRAKTNGKSRFCFFDPSADRKTTA